MKQTANSAGNDFGDNRVPGKGQKEGRNQALGCSRGGLTTNSHLAADAQGRPVRVILTPGQRRDVPQAPVLFDGFRSGYVIADAAYDSNAFRVLIAEIGALAVPPCNPTRKGLIPHDRAISKTRNCIERCFNKFKNSRRIATRYDRKAIHFLAFIHFACVMPWMR